MKSNVIIVCPIHGEFIQNAERHSQGQTCRECKKTEIKNSSRISLDTLIQRFNNVHNFRYDYSDTEYINAKTPIKIKCPIHGYFYQLVSVHERGNGCSRCSIKKGEFKIMVFLNKNNINYISQKTFKGCRDKGLLRFDFYLPDYNLCIEYDGEGHFKPIQYSKTNYTYKKAEEKFNKSKMTDRIKNEFCKNNNIDLLRIPYWEFNNIETILNFKLLYTNNKN